MTLAQYRRKFPNIDWSKPSPAAEMAMEERDVSAVLAEMAMPLVAWEVEIHSMSCVVFAATKAKAKWIAVRDFWEAYGSNGSWPHCSIVRSPFFDAFPHRGEAKAHNPEHVRSLC